MLHRLESSSRRFIGGEPREHKRNSANAPKPRELNQTPRILQVAAVKAIVREAMRQVAQAEPSASSRQGVVVEDPKTGKMFNIWDTQVIRMEDGAVASAGPADTGLFIDPVSIAPDNRLATDGSLMTLPRDARLVTRKTKVLLGDATTLPALLDLAQQIRRSIIVPRPQQS